jgi:hypothetical protein
MRGVFPLVAGLLLVACKSGEPDDTASYDLIQGPSLIHEVPEGDFPASVSLSLEVEAEDPDGVESVALFYRTQGDLVWENVDLEQGEGALWSAELVPDAPLLEYYFVGVDSSEYQVSSKLPTQADEAPFELPILVSGQPVPFTENFDLAVSRWSLYDLGWMEYSSGFQGAAWELSENHSYTGSWSAYHAAGPEEETISDWLVSPALDFSTLSSAQVTWFQMSTGEEPGEGEPPPSISIWASRTGGDPTEEGSGFQQVADLTLEPGADWERVPVVDLSSFAGDSRVYIAWNYSGSGWNWFLDQVVVEELKADLELIDVQYDHVDPGGITTVEAELLNRGAATDGLLAVWVEVDLADGTAGGAFNAGVLASGASALTESTVEIASDYPDNYGLNYTLWAEDDSQTWRWDLQLVVGDASLGTVQLETQAYGLVQAWIGSGDPASPTVELPLIQDLLDVGIWDFDVDLTNYSIYLPPDVGPDRWWVKVDSAEAGALTSFSIDYDGVTYLGDDLGEWTGGMERLFYLPRRPEPTIYSSSTNPTQIQPASNVIWDLTIQNKGGATKGVTTAEVTSLDPDVTITSGGPFEIAANGWPEGGVELLEVEFDVSVDQNDSTPIAFLVTITDEHEAYELDYELEVPWAVLVATEVLIDDWVGGNGDGVFDVGETASLEIKLTNLGDENTGNNLECTLSNSSAAVTVTFDEATDYYSYIAAGTSRTENDFSLTLDSGTAGDQVLLSMLCVDANSLTYPSTVELVVGEPLWSWVDPQPDLTGDSLNAYPFDIRSVRYREFNDLLQLRVSSSTAYDPATLFIESWFDSPGAGYDFYQVVAQSGVGTLRGYDSTFGFSTLGTLTVTDVSATEAQIDVDLSLVGLVVDTVEIGFAAGFCPATFYCDHYPDGWGDPYSGMATSSWFSLQW